MELRQMEYVVALADERHFTRAAEISGVSQSGLSAAIRSLETELGAVLFDRTTRRVEATAAGRAMIPHARAMLEEAARARDAVVQSSQSVSGALRVGAEQCLGIVDAAALLERFHRRYPLVETEFVQAGSHQLLDSMRAGELDVAFVAAHRHLGALRRQILGQEPLVLLVHPDHPLAGAGSVDWESLDNETFVDFGTSWGVRAMNDETFTAKGLNRRVRCSVSDVHTLLGLVGRGMGIAVVPQHVAAKPQAAGLSRLTLKNSASAEWTVSAVTATQESTSVPAVLLLELLQDIEPRRDVVTAA